MNRLSGKNVLIVGCGYIGQATAARLRANGCEVTGWVRTDETASSLGKAGVSPFVGDASSATDWKRIKPEFDCVVHCASSGRGGVDSYRAVYLEGMRRVTQHLAKCRIVFVSSTSVYAQNDGEIVTEKSLAQPTAETAKILREAEEEGSQAKAIVLRVAGIYGPERSVFLNKFRSGEAMIEGDGTRWINQVHRDDVAAAIVHALGQGEPGEIYNVCDNEPVTYTAFYEWLAPRLGRPMPPYGPTNPDRKRGLTNKRVSNEKLRSSGWSPIYPTFRDGYATILSEN
jgi:nucleoside-diphosphate-sugar epimerase